MILNKLKLQSFRSYRKQSFDFTSPVTVILGANTAGKTNILEAIFLLSTGKSFRAERETEMVRRGEEIGRIEARIKNIDLRFKNESSEEKDLEVMLTSGEVGGVKTPIKKYLVNGVPRRMIDFVGNLKVVLFWPEDLELVTGSPTLRRKYLDFVLSQVDREYRRSLFSYEKGVRQRNKVLESIRDGSANRSQLLFWNQLIIKTGNYLTDKRGAFVEAINAGTGIFGKFKVIYDKSVISEGRLEEYAEAEIQAAVTLVGPHRDDLMFFERDRDLSKFGSRGEQRLTVLWLKMAELGFIEEKSQEKPVLLLDDIFSELDHEHREEVTKIVSQQQTIITTTDRHFLPIKLVHKAQIVNLSL